MLPINDGYEPYINHLIESERKKPQELRNEDLIKSFELRLQSFRTQKNTFAELVQESKLSNGVQVITAQDIVDLKEKLMNIPTYGKEIRDYITEDPKETQIRHHNNVTIPQSTARSLGQKTVQGFKGFFGY